MLRIGILLSLISGGGIDVSSATEPHPSPAQAPESTRTITGTVIDAELKEPLPGVTIRIKGTSSAVVTDAEGRYSIEVNDNKTVLVFSFIGFTAQEVRVGNLGVIDIEMSPDDMELEEVVVVGAGVQKKVTVTGAITSINAKSLKMPTSSLTNAFAGQLPGVISMTTDGDPNSESSFFIRGISTFGGRTEPLILVDDVEISKEDLDDIPPETIESFSILKDASATAIYGSRGANGVMIIRTKTGNYNETTRVGVTVETAFNVPTGFPDFVDGATWMELYNEALESRHPGSPVRFSQEMIDATRSGADPYLYPDVDWNKALFRNYTTNQRANLNIRGGGSKATYYISLQANHDTGILNTRKVHSWDSNIDNWGYNFQNNITYQLTPLTNIDLRMNAQIRENRGGRFSPETLFAQIQNANPINFPITYPAQEGDTHIRFGSSFINGSSVRDNPYAQMLSSFVESRTNSINVSLKGTQGFDFITKGLSATLLVNFVSRSTSSFDRSIEPYFYRITGYDEATGEMMLDRLGTSGTDYIAESDIAKGGNQQFFLQGTIDYNRNFGLHQVGAMLLYTQREYKNDVLPSRNQGFSGRATYSYDYRYLAEFNFGYTGTERLAKGSRFEFFPAMSLGWVVSREDFFQSLTDVVSHLKLRASYGLIGSDETGSAAGHFLYMDNVTLQDNAMDYTTGEDLSNTKRGPNLKGRAIRNAVWEKALKFDFGIDAELFSGLSIVADYFYDKRYDILMQRKAWPQGLGYDEAKPWANIGKIDNWGFELSANYNKAITKDLQMELRANFTYTQNKNVDIDEPLYVYPWQSDTGLPMTVTRGYIAEGLFTTQEEADKGPEQAFGSTPMPGDIRYRDITGDGVVDYDDVTVISDYGSVPRIQYGLGASVQWKRWDLGVFFNGSAMRTIMSSLMNPFGPYDNNVFQFIADNRWDPANPNPDAVYPRLGVETSDTNNNAVASTYWMRDGSFLRFKQAEIGYSFPHGRVYLSGNNIAVFSSFKQWDPELSWNSYPLQRVFNLGLQLSF